MAFADCLVAPRPGAGADVWLYGADAGKIVVVPCGVDLNLFRPVPQDEARQILGLPAGRRVRPLCRADRAVEGIDTLLRAMAVLASDGASRQEDLSVIIVGGAPGAGAAQVKSELERLQHLQAELGIEHLVTFMGAQNQDTLVYYYSAADVTVVPSRYESFGMVALEAMAVAHGDRLQGGWSRLHRSRMGGPAFWCPIADPSYGGQDPIVARRQRLTSPVGAQPRIGLDVRLAGHAGSDTGVYDRPVGSRATGTGVQRIAAGLAARMKLQSLRPLYCAVPGGITNSRWVSLRLDKSQ